MQHGALPPGQQDDTLLSIKDAPELDIKVEQTLTGYNHYGTHVSVNKIPKTKEFFSSSNAADARYSINTK